VERRSIEDQINNFGQTPSQLLKKPHPKRLKRSEAIGSNIFDKFNKEICFYAETTAECLILLPWLNLEHSSPVKTVPDLYSGKLIGIDKNLNAWVYSWRITASKEFMLWADERRAVDRKIPIYLPNLSPKSFLANMRHEYIIVIGCPDRSFKIVSNLDKKPTILRSISYGHSDIITCAALSEDDKILVTGSIDSNVAIWQLRSRGLVKLKYTIFNHENEITAVDISKDNDIIISASKDGKIHIHSLIEETLIRTFSQTECLNISQISINSSCEIVFSSDSINSGQFSTLHLYSVNGKLISKQDFGIKISNFLFSKDGSHIIVSGSSGSLSLHYTHDFSHMHKFIQDSTLPITFALLYPLTESFLHVSRETSHGNIELVLISTDQVLGE
jgi:WD40 repeat protein